jgi:hypothetical protein
MSHISLFSNIALSLAGLGIMGFSRFCLRNHKKHREKTLEAIEPRFKGIKQSYASKFRIVLLVFLLSFAVTLTKGRLLNQHVAFIPILSLCVASALFDGIYALRIGAFSASNNFNWDRFVLNPGKTLNWIAYWQIALALFLAIAEIVLFVF